MTMNETYQPKITLSDLQDDFDYTDDDFKVVLENHLPRLKSLCYTVKIAPAEAYKYDYDFYNLLRYKNIDYRLHWITLRCNDRLDPYSKCSELKSILVPPMEEIQRLLLYHRSMKALNDE